MSHKRETKLRHLRLWLMLLVIVVDFFIVPSIIIILLKPSSNPYLIVTYLGAIALVNIFTRLYKYVGPYLVKYHAGNKVVGLLQVHFDHDARMKVNPEDCRLFIFIYSTFIVFSLPVFNFLNTMLENIFTSIQRDKLKSQNG